MIPLHKRFWAEIDLDSALHNFNYIKQHLSDKTKICCVVKADAYGHGAIQLSKLYEKHGVDYFAVSNIEEAIQLRKNGIHKPILILGYTSPDCAAFLSEYDIEQSVFSFSYAEKLNACAKKNGVKIKIHIKLDSGMGRLGFSCKQRVNTDELVEAYRSCNLENLVPYGVFTHFAAADEKEEGADYTKTQCENFKFGIDFLKAQGINFKIRHCSNSAGIFEYPDYQFDMVRAGIVLYGLSPSEKTFDTNLKPVMSLKANISQIKTLKKNECVSYGCSYKAKNDVVVATIPVGYADGFWRCNNFKKADILINGERSEIIGRICMDQIMADVSHLYKVTEEDTAVLLGRSEDDFISADEIAKRCGTINYEVVCAVGKRVTRIYYQDGKITDICDNILNIEDIIGEIYE